MASAEMRAIVASVSVGVAALLPLHGFAEPVTNGPVTVQEIGEWVTPVTFPGDLQIAHVRVRISAQTPVDIYASDFVGTVQADTGGTQRLAALGWPAPPYENAGLIGIAGSRPAVDPPEDLGSFGRLHLAAGSTVVGILSYELPFAVNAARPIQSIAFRPFVP